MLHVYQSWDSRVHGFLCLWYLKSFIQNYFVPVTPPSQRVQFILGEDDDDDGTHLSHPIFSEMETLTEMEGGEMEWKETARYVL